MVFNCMGKVMKRRKVNINKRDQLDESASIRVLYQKGTYKYLEIDEGDRIQHGKMKKKIKKCYRQVRAVLRTKLNAKKQTGINQHATNTCNWL